MCECAGMSSTVSPMRVLITGASRGIGRAIARRFAERYGPDLMVGLLARSKDTPVHSSLRGSLRETAAEIAAYGSVAFQYPVDLRNVDAVRTSVSKFLHTAGGLDVLINSASTLVPNLAKQGGDKHRTLSYEVNTRGTMVCIDACRDALHESPRTGSIVTVSPPIRLGRLDRLSLHGVPYTVSKYSMTLATLAEARADADSPMRANCVWPRHMVSTAATARLERTVGLAPGAHARDAADFANAVVRLAVDDGHRNGESVFDDDVLPLPRTQSPLDAYAEQRIEPAHYQ